MNESYARLVDWESEHRLESRNGDPIQSSVILLCLPAVVNQGIVRS